jgi:cutinase
VAAVVVFGNPLNARGRTIEESAHEFGARTKEFCANGDPVCGGGANFAAHLAYPRNGDVQEAAEFAASQINGS